MRGLLPQTRGRARRLVWLSLFAALLSLGLFVSSASATVVKYASIERLVEISDIIVRAEVSDQTTYFDQKQGRVVTDTTLAVEKVFWGKPGKQITVQQWGGTYNGQTHFISGDARFEVGEEIFAFLHTSGDVVALSALGQAKFSVEEIDKKTLVTRDLSDLTFLLDDDGDQKVGHLPSESHSLESFVAELESLVAGIKGGDRE